MSVIFIKKIDTTKPSGGGEILPEGCIQYEYISA